MQTMLPQHRQTCLFLAALLAGLVFAECAHKPPPWSSRISPVEQFGPDVDLSLRLDSDSVDVPLLEWAIFLETNRQRARLGLKPLKFEPRLQYVAEQHSREMVRLGYFEHNSPVPSNATLTKRIRHVGIKEGIGGENIAIHPVTRRQDAIFRAAQAGPTASKYAWRNEGDDYTYAEFARDLVNRWLNSPPHRRNVLNKQFHYLGVGLAQARYKDIEVFYVTQDFSSANY